MTPWLLKFSTDSAQRVFSDASPPTSLRWGQGSVGEREARVSGGREDGPEDRERRASACNTPGTFRFQILTLLGGSGKNMLWGKFWGINA